MELESKLQPELNLPGCICRSSDPARYRQVEIAGRGKDIRVGFEEVRVVEDIEEARGNLSDLEASRPRSPVCRMR